MSWQITICGGKASVEGDDWAEETSEDMAAVTEQALKFKEAIEAAGHLVTQTVANGASIGVQSAKLPDREPINPPDTTSTSSTAKGYSGNRGYGK